MQIERVGAGEYKIIGLGKDKKCIAVVDSLEKASCVLRFINGSSIKGSEYQLAVNTIREIDKEEDEKNTIRVESMTEEERKALIKWLKGMEGSDETQRVSGEADNGISDGSPSD